MKLPAPPATSDDAFWYEFNPPALTANQQGVTFQLLLDSDADFIWDQIFTSAFGLFSMSLIDSSRGLPLIGSSDGQPVNVENFSFIEQAIGLGGPALGLWLPKPYRLPAGTLLSAVFNNRIGGPGVNIVTVVLSGYKDFQT